MYHQLTSEQRSQIFALLQKKTSGKEIAGIVGTSQATLSREIRRNSTPSGKYIWIKAHGMAMQRRNRTVTNARLPDGLVWRLLLPYKDCLKTITTDNLPGQPAKTSSGFND